MKVNYSLSSLEEISYKVNFDMADDTAIDKSKVKFRIAHKIKINREKNEIIIVLYVFILDLSTNIELIKNGVQAIFKIEPFDAVVKNIEDDEIKVFTPALMDTFLNVSIGAVRGIWAKNLKGTPLSGLVLPLIPMQVVRENSIKNDKSD